MIASGARRPRRGRRLRTRRPGPAGRPSRRDPRRRPGEGRRGHRTRTAPGGRLPRCPS
ncbi:hypothetical protein LT493_36395 [Streptomyces tricolor]|nr:hypothetical protein [Streptomyces tricolor]